MAGAFGVTDLLRCQRRCDRAGVAGPDAPGHDRSHDQRRGHHSHHPATRHDRSVGLGVSCQKVRVAFVTWEHPGVDPEWLDQAPLLRAWVDAQRRLGSGELRPFTTPGHKQRTHLVGDLAAGDLPLYGGLAPIRGTDALVREAEARTAARWGADWCRYSAGGSTHGNQALTLAVGTPGDTVVVDRTCHRSLLLGLVLAGLRPVWVHPALDASTGLPLGVAADTVAEALARHPDARAVFVTSPSYVGTCADVGALSEVTRTAGIPLLVDA